ncbi:glutamine--fructose-6-phosphate transaminase (isomerizing) [Candidatus Protochlamydia phocaeensis]|uniref:glutamine--fructose-6-phosphate transaminase (isomerizing) n=1 Tax=Candidatus Protochlamydia phocaeensis TaxID=1414722 RepID=UPI0008392863|nr:glutamine--fructose-6-phosphate transaminase (isomerizing) [Candidatus Protochlamydia phocaeensis]
MCGIFGYVGSKDPVKTVIEGLKKLEYRGYDSAGIAGIEDGKIVYCKEVGKVSILEQEVKKQDFHLDLAIAQTRWATHGKVTRVNAHPHFDSQHSLALVHNGIIENHEALRKQLKEKGINFVSDTDTEVIAHLIASYYEGDILQAVQKASGQLKGAYAVALIHRDFPNQIVAIAHECPLVIGIGANEAFVSSDPNAFAFYTRQAIYLSNSEIAIIKADSQQIYNADQQITKESHLLDTDLDSISKGRFEHYTLKEIHEQPQAIRNALLSRFLPEYGTALFEELNFNAMDLLTVERILILACGTSWHAGYVAAYMLEDKARIPVQVEISSEFRYKNPLVPPGTFVIAISQSGETADTIAAMREVKAKGARVLALCNVQSSTLAREADSTIFLKAGAEIGVCSTKAFTSQVVVLALFTLLMARMRHMSKAEGQEFLNALLKLPDQVQAVLDQSERIEALAKKYAHYDNFFYLGRRYMYPTSLEGALKLKEISYINANGYPAGEIKHGPIALINENCPAVALCANQMTYEKLLSNLMEIKARNGKIIAISEEDNGSLEEIVDDIIYVPRTIDELAAIPTTVVNQLLAYYIAKERGADIDQPRNLAKSVTVE